MDDPSSTYREIRQARIEGLRSFELGGIRYSIDRAASIAWSEFSSVQRGGLGSLCGDEPLEHHRRWLDVFFAGRWATAVREGTITRAAYVATLANLHSYVRHTTRLLGLAVAYSQTTSLRAHFASHLRGEVNHEVSIERDLLALGEDVDWVTRSREPDPATKRFAVVQDSTIGHHRDPVAFLACPLTAEGVTASMGREYVDGLHAAVSSWGVSDPATVTTFLRSHLHTDGGDDGHHIAVSHRIASEVTDEPTLRRFLSVQTAAQSAFFDAFEEAIDCTWAA